jgi:dihydroxyacetone kinase
MKNELDPEIVLEALRASLEAVAGAEESLGRLDAAAGDGDHGRGMVRGFRAAVTAAEGEASGAERLQQAGRAFSDAAGGASGMLYGTIIETLGASLAEAPVDAPALANAFRRALEEVLDIGGAEPGDKTLVDALEPFVERFEELAREGRPVTACWSASVDAAQQGAELTASLVARRGRAARLGERSRGQADPGATSLALVLATVGSVIEARWPSAPP